MTSPRTSALSILAVYWLMLILGMASCIMIRSDAQIAAIWTGTVAGTALGHALALLNTRNWFALLTVLTTAAIVGPSAPGELSASTLWLAFIPAACCAFWSLGDRTTLVAFWFPAVIWMLSILDHAHANGIPDDNGIVLLGVLALLFLLFLRVRETRRVALWSAVPAPSITLAEQKSPVMLRERPGFRLARAGWALLASALAFGATAWVAPRLWQSESLAGESTQVAIDHTGPGLPCCPIIEDVETPRARVKEYFAIGRGHDEEPIEQPPQSCRRCDVGGTEVAGGRPSLSVTGDLYPYDGPATYSPNGYVVDEPRQRGSVGYSGTVVPGDPWESGRAPQYTPQQYAPPTWNPPTVTGRTYTPPAEVYVPPDSDGIDHPSTANTPTAPPPVESPPITAQTIPWTNEPPPPPPQAPAPPPVAPFSAVAPAPEPPPAVEPQHAETATAAAPAPVSAKARRPASTIIGPSLLQWVGVILAAAVLVQLAALALRPIRRLVTLRHLRKPYWEETVDQRVSNAWQLALVGLRDAGWRPDANESPRDLAQRVGIDGVERCAAILDRARHGIGIDAEDLSTMTSSAEAAYQDARSRLGRVARAATWLRWPLT